LHAKYDGLRHAIDDRADGNAERAAGALGAKLLVHEAVAKNEDPCADQDPQGI
jgi:hypothetical protein